MQDVGRCTGVCICQGSSPTQNSSCIKDVVIRRRFAGLEGRVKEIGQDARLPVDHNQGQLGPSLGLGWKEQRWCGWSQGGGPALQDLGLGRLGHCQDSD